MSETAEIHARPKFIGARIKRVEDPRLLTGRGAYTDDCRATGVLHVAFRRSDHSHARILGIDCAAARASAGVVAIFTAEDLAGFVKPLVATSRMVNYYATPILPLAREKVRYVGEPVVGIVALSRYQAEDAADRVFIDYHSLPVIGDPEQAASANAPLLHQCAGEPRVQARRCR
jgi:carbon-monoxide dehydrogenase large subunit